MLLEVEGNLLEWGPGSEWEVDERPSRGRAERLEGCLSDSRFSSKMDL